MRRAVVPAALLTGLLLCSCGPKAITAGSRPFPSKRAVFADASGKALFSPPDAAEPVRLVLLDFPWCPACADVWTALREAARPFPKGTVRLYRVLFDREMSLSASGNREVPPLRPTPAPWPEEPGGAGTPEITTLSAFPGAFHEEFRVSQGPVLLLLAPDGKVERRWAGSSTGLSAEISDEIRKRSPSPSPLPPGK